MAFRKVPHIKLYTGGLQYLWIWDQRISESVGSKLADLGSPRTIWTQPMLCSSSSWRVFWGTASLALRMPSKGRKHHFWLLATSLALRIPCGCDRNTAMVKFRRKQAAWPVDLNYLQVLLSVGTSGIDNKGEPVMPFTQIYSVAMFRILCASLCASHKRAEVHIKEQSKWFEAWVKKVAGGKFFILLGNTGTQTHFIKLTSRRCGRGKKKVFFPRLIIRIPCHDFH